VTNYYQVLGVSKDATETEIRDRFRVMARESHPDRQRDPEKKREAEVRFQILTEAVNVLTNPTRRKAHDFDLGKGGEGATHDPKEIAKVYLAKGVKAYKEGNFSESVANFDMAVKHNPNDAKAQYNLAMACEKMPSQVRKGADAIEAAIRLDANNALYRREAGKLYLMAGLPAKAERHLEEALKWLPDDAETRRLLAELKGGSDPKKSLGSFFGRKG
jgi:DnaJ-class molecular chaperone